MSGSSAEVLQEYLVSLGFRTDAISLRKFEDGLGITGKRVLKIGGAVAGVVAGVEAAAAAFAYSMRKMYFESELSNSSVKNLKAIGYAGKQIGIDMSGALHSMAQAMRMNPGMQALVESFGVKVSGRDMSDVAIDFVEALSKMPEYQGVQFAQMFGIDPDTYHQMINHMAELKAKRQELLNSYKNAGYDPDKAKKTILEYTEAMDKLEMQLSMLGQNLLVKFSPQFKDFTKVIAESLDWWIKWAAGINSVSDAFKGLTLKDVGQMIRDSFDNSKGIIAGFAKGGLVGAVRAALNANEDQSPQQVVPNPHAQRSATPGTTSKSSAKAHLANLEKQYGLPPGLLFKMWGAESAYGTRMVSNKGALGHFQFMPKTAKEFGLKDPFDFKSSSSAAARKMAGLMKLYNGNTAMALAAYNWGEGNLKKHGLENAPRETRDYVEKIAGLDTRLGAANVDRSVHVNQTTNINVNGTGAKETAVAVAREQDRVNADVVRNLKAPVS